MEFMAGYDEQGGRKERYERKIRRADLRDGMVTLRPLGRKDEKRVVEASIVELRMSWPPFDVQIWKFE